jgi:stearoyl-CoA desaturase (delta-9 desaturase)
VDLITPASTWSVQPHHEKMPLLQRAVMFCSVVGPFVGLLAGIVLLWRRHFIGWPEIAVMSIMYTLCGFSVTIGFHRLLTHRAFETYRPIKLFLAIFGSMAGQGMAIKWIATHRRHHQLSDREGDPHTPHHHGEGVRGLLLGLFHAHVAWCFDADKPDLARSVPDLLEDRAMLLVDKLYFLWVGLGILIPGIVLGFYYHSWQAFLSGAVWGGVLRIFLLQHVTWSINSVCHVWGSRTFNSADHSTNNFPIAIVSLGEGWHNNHHAFPTSARHGLQWWQIDPSWLMIATFQKIGLAWDVRLPSDAAIDAKKRAA